jgi:threonine dehydratase
MAKTSKASLAQLPVVLEDIEKAAGVIAGFVKQTSCERSHTLSDITGASIWLKFENLQFTATFKERGALNRLSALSADERRRGVIAASAGNHAQGVAYHAARLAIPATIFMPIGTPTVKIENTRRHGATVMEGGSTLEEAAALATDHGREHGLTYIPPYDDPLIIAGQGTIGLEMLAAVPDLDVLIVPIGGGGLISGIATAVKATAPDVRIVGVEPELSPAMHVAFEAGEPTPVEPRSIADGLNAPFAGENTLPICRALVDEMVLVSEDEIHTAFRFLYERAKLACEPAGAVSTAALLAGKIDLDVTGTTVAVVSGGNVAPQTAVAILAEE